MRKIFSFDAETNGLWGQAFAIGAIVYGTNGEEATRFVGRCPIEEAVDDWVQDNVLPQMVDISETHADYDSLLADFAEFYLQEKAEADMVVHMGVPVEAKLLLDLRQRGLIGDWDGPFPLLDLAGMLAQAGEDPTSVDSYVQKYGVEVREMGSTHNPLYDSEIAAKVYRHLKGWD